MVPGHSKVLTCSVLTGTLPGLNGETIFAEYFLNLLLKKFHISDGAGSDPSVIYVSVFQDSLEDGRLKIGGES